MKISVICPTYNRHDYLEKMYKIFQKQTYKNTELLILDDSESPSPFFTRLKNPKVRYTHQPAGETRMKIGTKRNRLIEQATGDVIAHFDDDDYYGPRYLETMVKYLSDSDVVTLRGWYVYSLPHGFFGYWDKSGAFPICFKVNPNQEIDRGPSQGWFNDEILEKNTWGYGATYLYRRSLVENYQFDNISIGEDYRWYKKVTNAGHQAIAIHDEKGIFLKLINITNCSGAYPQYRLPSFALDKIIGKGFRHIYQPESLLLHV